MCGYMYDCMRSSKKTIEAGSDESAGAGRRRVEMAGPWMMSYACSGPSFRSTGIPGRASAPVRASRWKTTVSMRPWGQNEMS